MKIVSTINEVREQVKEWKKKRREYDRVCSDHGDLT